MYRKIFCFVAIALLWSSTIQAQQKELDAGIKYEINNITVAGAQSYNDQTVVAFTGLKKGERILRSGPAFLACACAAAMNSLRLRNCIMVATWNNKTACS